MKTALSILSIIILVVLVATDPRPSWSEQKAQQKAERIARYQATMPTRVPLTDAEREESRRRLESANACIAQHNDKMRGIGLGTLLPDKCLNIITARAMSGFATSNGFIMPYGK